MSPTYSVSAAQTNLPRLLRDAQEEGSIAITRRDETVEQGDIKPLEGALENYVRLRARNFRVIFTYAEAKRGERLIRCVFAERRGAVYALFQETLRAQLLAREEGSIET